ncbi:MAG: lipoyl domain-containing protein [Leptospira sp.]|nr:lipoyl domain-containing protein [Leptospira sp.]
MEQKEFYLRTPDLGDTEKIELIRWSFIPGDTIHEGDEVIELVTDKAAFPVESPFNGILKEIRVPAGSQVLKGDILGVLEITE